MEVKFSVDLSVLMKFSVYQAIIDLLSKILQKNRWIVVK